MNQVPPDLQANTWQWRAPSFGTFLASLWADLVGFVRERKWRKWHWALQMLSAALLVIVPVLVYAYRYAWQPYLLLVPRIYAVAILATAGIAIGGWLLMGRLLPASFARFLKPVGALLGVVLVMGAAAYGRDLHAYFAQDWRYRTLDTIEPKDYPTTGEERIWPLNGIYSYAQQQMNETEAPTKPNLVRDGKSFVWTFAVEPGTPVLRYFDAIEEVVSIPSTVVSFDLKRGENVYFETGETLLFSRNIRTCVRRSFWFWQAATYEPAANVIYLKNDAGKYVQVVPLIKWVGWIFPRPEFGGVYVVEQGRKDRSWLGERMQTLKRVFLGCGSQIAPERIKDHPYLVGQNIVPFEVTRYRAASTRFRAGILAPTPWRREGDVRIADLPDDVNQQPFTLFFNVRVDGKVVASKLFHYFALEPEAADKQGLSTSVLDPADGIGPVYVFWHFGRTDSCIGVSAVSGWVRSSKRNYDWSSNQPVEHRPYLRDIPDGKGRVKTRWTWLTTIVTVDKDKLKDKDPRGFVTGSPEIAITDCRHKETVWVNRRRPDLWPGELRESLAPLWDEEQ